MTRKPSLLRRVAAGFATMVLTASALFVASQPLSHAEENKAIKFTSAKLTHVNENGEEIPAPGRQLTTGDYFYLDVAYDATDASPKAGDSFTIGLPDAFDNRDHGNSQRVVVKPLEYRSPDGTTATAGECKIEQRLITCSFNDAIAGKADVAGTILTQLVARNATDKTSSSFLLNGDPVDVAHPWGEDIVPAEVKAFKPDTRVAKGSKGVGLASTEVNWRIGMGGAWLKRHYPNGGPITITDTIQAGMDLPAQASVKLVEVGPNATTGKAEDRVVATGDGTTQEGGFGVATSVEVRTVTFKLTGPFSFDRDYRVDYDTKFSGGSTIVPGHEYHNQAHFVEADLDTDDAVRVYFESFKATVTYRQGFGGFEVTKSTMGSALPSAGQKFTVQVRYELPAGKTAADYPGWDAPANPAQLEVTVGHTTSFPGSFPTGTTVTLSEDVSSANPATPFVRWGAPVFSSKDSRVAIGKDQLTATFKVADRASLPVMLTNSATGVGTLSIATKVTGDDADALAAQEFAFDYTCSDGTAGTVTTSSAQGAKTVDGKLVDGVTCAITEQTPGEREGYTLNAPESQTVTIAGGRDVSVVFENNYKKKPEPTQSAKPEPTQSAKPEPTQSADPTSAPRATVGPSAPNADAQPAAPQSPTAAPAGESTVMPSAAPRRTAPPAPVAIKPRLPRTGS